MKPFIAVEPDGSQWVTLEAFDEQEKRFTLRLVRLHRGSCTPDNCVLDGGEEHDEAFKMGANCVGVIGLSGVDRPVP